MLIAGLVPGIGDTALTRALAVTLIGAMIVHVALIVFENLLAQNQTRHHSWRSPPSAAARSRRCSGAGRLAASLPCPSSAAALFAQLPGGALIAAVLALAGSFAWEYVWVEAGQSVPLS